MSYKLRNHDPLKSMNIVNNNNDRNKLIKVVTGPLLTAIELPKPLRQKKKDNKYLIDKAYS